MPPKFRAGGKGKKQRGKTKELGASATRYTGPIDIGAPGRRTEPRTWECPITDTIKGTVTLSANVGVWNRVVAAVDVLSSSTYTLYAGDWQEMRVLGIKLKYIPQNYGYQPNTVPAATMVDSGVHVMAPYRGNSTVLGSTQQAVAHKPASFKTIADYHGAEIRMDESDESNFVSVSGATVPAVFGIKLRWDSTFNGSASAVVIFGYYVVTWLVQFRGLVDGSTQIKLPPAPSPASPMDGEQKEDADSVIVDGPVLAQSLRDYVMARSNLAGATAGACPVRPKAAPPTKTGK